MDIAGFETYLCTGLQPAQMLLSAGTLTSRALFFSSSSNRALSRSSETNTFAAKEVLLRSFQLVKCTFRSDSLSCQFGELPKWTESGHELTLTDHVRDLDPLERRRC